MRTRLLTIATAVALVVSVATSAWASCAAELVAAPKAQMACCENGHDQCPMHRSTSQSAKDCCQHENQRQQELTAAEQPSAHAPSVTLEQIAAVAPHAVLPAPEAAMSALYSRGFTSPPTPRTSLSNVLRI